MNQLEGCKSLQCDGDNRSKDQASYFLKITCMISCISTVVPNFFQHMTHIKNGTICIVHTGVKPPGHSQSTGLAWAHSLLTSYCVALRVESINILATPFPSSGTPVCQGPSVEKVG